MTTYYAYTPSIDAGTGSLLFDSTTRSWTEGQPMLQTVLLCLRTSRGSCPLDPTLGPDHGILRKALPDTGVRWRASVLAALKRYVDAGRIADVSCTVDYAGTTLLYTVSFMDVRTNQRTATGQLSAMIG